MGTHVREFIKPHPVKITRKEVDAKGSVTVREYDYSFEDYWGDFVASYPKWNETDEWGDAQIRLQEAIDSTADGEPVKIASLDDWEKLRDANKEAKIQGPMAGRIRKHQRAVKSATAPKE